MIGRRILLLFEQGVTSILTLTHEKLEDPLDSPLNMESERIVHLVLLVCSIGYFLYLRRFRLPR